MPAESSGETALHLAAKYGIIEVVSYLLSTNPNCEVDTQSADCGWTALMFAAACGYTNVCRMLINAKADMFATDFFGQSALHASTTWNPVDPTDYTHLDFFQNKLNTMLQTDRERLTQLLVKSSCPLYYIINFEDIELTKSIRKLGYAIPKSSTKDNSLLIDAVCAMKLENVKLVLEQMNIDVNFLDEYKYSPMHYAVENGDENGNVSIVKYLLDKGADIDIRGIDGMTPLLAVFNGYTTVEQRKQCIYFLLQHGADPQKFDNIGYTIIDYGMDETIEDYDETLLDPVISHLALQEIIGTPIVDVLGRQIEEEENVNYYYESCKKCLNDMKKITVSGQVTMYKLLSESDDRVIEYFRNPAVARSFVHTMFDSNFYYGYVLRKRFVNAMDIIKHERQ